MSRQPPPSDSFDETTSGWFAPGGWLRLGIALVLSGQAMMFGLGFNNTPFDERPGPGQPTYYLLHGGLLLSCLIVIGLLGGPLAHSTWAALRHRRLTIELLFAGSLVGAFAGSVLASLTGGEAIYYEIVPIVLAVYALGQKIGERSQAAAVRALRQLRQEFSTACLKDGGIVPVELLQPGALVRIAPGGAIVVDGRIVEGRGEILETMWTGSTHPVLRQSGDKVWAGSYSLDGDWVVAVEAPGGRRRFDAMLTEVENSRLEEAPALVGLDRWLKIFIPAVFIVAAATFLVWWGLGELPWWSALYRSMSVLLVACPCALGLASPLVLWKALLTLAKRGLVARHGGLVERLAAVNLVVFDKTGTLTDDRWLLAGFDMAESWSGRQDEILAMAAVLEAELDHPAARGLVVAERRHRSSNPSMPVWQLHSRQWHAGLGVEGEVTGDDGTVRHLHIGRLELMPMAPRRFIYELGMDTVGEKHPWEEIFGEMMSVYIAVDGEPAALCILRQTWRDSWEKAAGLLRSASLDLAILSGDPSSDGLVVAGLTVQGGLSPGVKAQRIKEWQDTGRQVLFVGDGLNDSPALSTANASLALAHGAPLTRGLADGILTGGNLATIGWAIVQCRFFARRLIWLRRFAIFYNVVGLTLAAGGFLHPVAAALLMAMSSATVSWFALREAPESISGE